MRRLPLLLALAAALAGSAAPAPAHDENAASGFLQDLRADFERTSGRIVALAEAVPAEQYGWRPAEGVRSIGEVYMHVVGPNTFLPLALGAAAPAGMTMPEDPFATAQEWEQTVTAKDEVLARLRASIDYAAQAIPQIQDLDTQVDAFGFPASKRAYLLILLTHAHEHLGQSIAYARSIGVVPPWSRPQITEGEGGTASE